MQTKHLLIALGLGGLLAPLASAQLNVTISGEIRLGRRPPPPPPAVVVVVPDGPGEPPPWIHGRWYQRSHEYYYYPGYDVYYRLSDHVWFFQDRGQWRYGRVLPEGLNVEFDRSVRLTMATDRPYLFHRQVTARYPSDYFARRVRIRDEHRDERAHDSRGRDKDDHRSDRGRDDDAHGKSRDRDRN